MHPDPAVIDMFFVNVVPGWGPKNETWVNGQSNVGRDGISLFVGDNSLTTPSGLERIAHWAAHEIGHNLGLVHIPDSTLNLMNETRVSQQLDAEQIDAIFQTQSRNDGVAYIPAGGTGFPQPQPQLLAGDYNRDGKVDAADYTVWRNASSLSLFNPSADGDGNGAVDADDYDAWKSHYGLSVFVLGGGTNTGVPAVPEPATFVSALLSAAVLLFRRRASR